MLHDRGQNLRLRLTTILQVARPVATGMQCVPLRPPLIPTPASRIVVAKSVDGDVPNGLILSDQHLFGQPDPYRIEYEPATREVGKLEILCRFNGAGMNRKPLLERSIRPVRYTAALATAGGSALPT